MFNKDIEELISTRISHRSFLSTRVEKPVLEQICEVASIVSTPFGSTIQIEPIEIEGDISKELKELGAYGMIRGASSFIVGSGLTTADSLVDFGYVFEHALLKATDLGLGSCWVGGSLNRSSFASRIKLHEQSSVICVSPIGYSAQKQPIKDRFIRFATGAAKRKPWNELFFKGDFNEKLEKQDVKSYIQPLEMLRLAPSASNKQPWRVVLDNKTGHFHFYISRSPFYQKIMAKMSIPDLQLVDLGICMSHFQLSAKKEGLAGKWTKVIPPKIALPPNVQYIESWEQ